MEDKMYLNGLSEFITGLTYMASSVSKEIGPSYVAAECFGKDNYIKEFAEFYNISEDSVKIVESKDTLEDIFKMWFGSNNSDIVGGLIHWIRIKIGDVIKVYELCEDCSIIDKLGWGDGGQSPFCFCENVYFVESKNVVVAFLIGNDE